MGNLGGAEILVILLVALIVLGPTKLPPAIRQVGKVVGEIRRIGQGFQQELREAAQPLQEATADLKAADKSLREAAQKPLKEMTDTLKAADPRQAIPPLPDPGSNRGAADGRDTSGAAGDTASSVPPAPASWGTAAASIAPPPAPAGETTGTSPPGDGIDTAAGDQSPAEPDAAEPDARPQAAATGPDAGPQAADVEAAAAEPRANESEAVEPDADAGPRAALEEAESDPEARAGGAA